MEALRFSKTARRVFHDVNYVLTVSGDAENLGIEVEHAEDGRRWKSQFGARFIEEITQRTGNHKKFDVFVKMVLSALVQESDCVYLDVLTARDLEMLRRHANPQGPPTTSTAGQSDKRYLILTYRAEFDKVHYPLPLQLEERTEEETLRAMVARLHAELGEAHEKIASFKQGAGEDRKHVQGSAEEDYRQLQLARAEDADALSKQKQENEALKAELRMLRSEKDRGGSGSANNLHAEVNRLKDTCQRQQAELKSLKDEARRKEQSQKRETEQTARELRAARQNVERLQAQVKKLEDERKNMGNRQQSSSRVPSAERSRPQSRSPSVERAGSRQPSRVPSRPASQPRSRPTSRASSVASSRERTPSPNSHLPSNRHRNSAESRPWAQRNNASPGGGRRNVPSPGGTSSPYGHTLSGSIRPRRTPSPGQRSRERTPSPGQHRSRGNSVGAIGNPSIAGSGASAPSRRSALSLREQRVGSVIDSSSALGGGNRPRPAPAARHLRSGSASRYQDQAPESSLRAGSQGALARQLPPLGSDEESLHKPGSLFGLAANLGLGPGSLSAQNAPSSATPSGVASSNSDGAVDVCDIDARLQALQSFLKQTKTITA